MNNAESLNKSEIITSSTVIETGRSFQQSHSISGRKTFVLATRSTDDSLMIVKGEEPDDRRLKLAHIIYDKTILKKHQLTCDSKEGPMMHPEGYRSLHISVMPKLQKMTIQTGTPFVKAWLETLTCHASQWKHGVRHGDPSLSSLMYNPQHGMGVLVDFDMVTLQAFPGPSPSNTHILPGTLPFMALEHLTFGYFKGEIARSYHHELEAFIWIVLYVFLSYQDGRHCLRITPAVPNEYLQGIDITDEWRVSDYGVVYEKKLRMLTSADIAVLLIQPSFAHCQSFMVALFRLLRENNRAREDDQINRLLMPRTQTSETTAPGYWAKQICDGFVSVFNKLVAVESFEILSPLVEQLTANRPNFGLSLDPLPPLFLEMKERYSAIINLPK